MTPEEQKFVLENLNTDVAQLVLNPPKEFKKNISFLADQIQARKKAKDKLPTWYANPNLLFPAPLSVEQSSSEIAADYKAQLVQGSVLVDLTGGMGVDSLAFAKTFDKVIYVERNSALCECLRHNAAAFDQSIEIVNSKAEDFLPSFEPKENTVFYIDPARRDSNARKVFRFSDCTPDVSDLLPFFRKSNSKVLIKASPLIDLKLGISELQSVIEIHVVSIKNDCKEVLFLLDFASVGSSNPLIRTINFSVPDEHFNFKSLDESNAQVKYSLPLKYLLVPNVAIMKAGAFKTISEKFSIGKLSPNTHLYTSANPVVGFPGRQFEILEAKPDETSLQKHLVNKQVNIISKNHPLSVPQILKKYQLSEGGDHYIIAFRDKDEKPRICLARLILEPAKTE